MIVTTNKKRPFDSFRLMHKAGKYIVTNGFDILDEEAYCIKTCKFCAV